MSFHKVSHNGSDTLWKHLDMVQHRGTTQMLKNKGRKSEDAVTPGKVCRELLPQVQTCLDCSDLIAWLLDREWRHLNGFRSSLHFQKQLRCLETFVKRWHRRSDHKLQLHLLQMIQGADWGHQASCTYLSTCLPKATDQLNDFETFIHNQTRFIPLSSRAGYKFKHT